MQHRVQKLLSNYGYTSRRKAEDLIKQGKVRINDKVAKIGDKATEDDRLYVDDILVSKPKKIYLMFNKPLGCVTALEDRQYKTIMDYIRTKERIFPVGRLDYNTSGLLLLTNDGDFANRIIHPRYEINKTYWVKISRPISNQHLFSIQKGVKLEDGTTSPAEIRKVDDMEVELAIHEGKKRIIRRMFKSLGYDVQALVRTKIGNLELGDLRDGKYRTLSKEEMKRIFE